MAKLLPSSNEYDFVDLNNLGSARFIVTVDTEEEFNWSAPFSRQQRSVGHLAKADRFQNLCEEFGVKPIYLIDHPVATDAAAIRILGDFAAQDKASIGLHLHPWVTPPFVEEVNSHNSYSCNLSPELEREKLEVLYKTVQDNFGIVPEIYRAGRYGVGANTVNVLQDLDIRFDTSVRACFDYSADSGPNFTLETDHPYWLKRDSLIELPVTTVFGGKMRQFGKIAFNSVFNSNIARGVLAKTGMLERIAFTPEGIPVEKMLEGIELALQSGIGILNFSFHSPSLAPGFTPYVRNDEDLGSFYNWWRIVFEYMEARGVRPVSLDQLSAGLMPAKANMPDLALARTGSDPLSARQ